MNLNFTRHPKEKYHNIQRKTSYPHADYELGKKYWTMVRVQIREEFSLHDHGLQLLRTIPSNSLRCSLISNTLVTTSYALNLLELVSVQEIRAEDVEESDSLTIAIVTCFAGEETLLFK